MQIETTVILCLTPLLDSQQTEEKFQLLVRVWRDMVACWEYMSIMYSVSIMESLWRFLKI